MVFREKEGIYFFKEGSLTYNTEPYELVMKIQLPLLREIEGHFLNQIMCHQTLPFMCGKYNGVIMSLNHRVKAIRDSTNAKLKTYFQFTRPIPNTWNWSNNEIRNPVRNKRNTVQSNNTLEQDYTIVREKRQAKEAFTEHLDRLEAKIQAKRLQQELRKQYQIFKRSHSTNLTFIEYARTFQPSKIITPTMGNDDLRVAKYASPGCETARRINALIDEIRLNRRGVVNLRNESYYFGNAVIDKVTEINNVLAAIQYAQFRIEGDLNYVGNVTEQELIKSRKMHQIVLHILALEVKVARWERSVAEVLYTIDKGLEAMNKDQLSPNLVPKDQLEHYLRMVEYQVHKYHPRYQLAFTDPFAYYFIHNVAYVLAKDAIYISIPVPLKVQNQPSLALYEIRKIPMKILDINRKPKGYVTYDGLPDYLAIRGNTMIELSQRDVDHCSHVDDDFVCSQLFIVREGDESNCLFQLFYDIHYPGHDLVSIIKSALCTTKRNIRHAQPNPQVMENETHYVIAHAPYPWEIFYNYNKKAPIYLNEVEVGAIEKSMLCDKRIRIGPLSLPGTERRCNDTPIIRVDIKHPFETIFNISNELDNLPFDNVSDHLFKLRNFTHMLNMSLTPLVLDKALEFVGDDHFLKDPRVNPNRAFYDEPFQFTNTHEWLLYAALIAAGVATVVFVVVLIRYQQLHVRTDSYIKTSSLSGAVMAGQVAESQARTIESDCARSAFDSHAMLVITYILAVIVTCYIVFRLYRYCRHQVVHETTIILQLKSLNDSEVLPIKTVTALPTDITIIGRLDTANIILDKQCCRDTIHYSTKSVTLFQDTKPILLPTFVPVPIICQNTVRNIIADGLVEVKILTSHGNYIHTPKNLSDIIHETKYLSSWQQRNSASNDTLNSIASSGDTDTP